jgi:hypothetical protein
VSEFRNEACFQVKVEREFRKHGWLVYHTRCSKKSAAGFPDVVAARPARLVIAELKMPGKLPTPEQEHWLRLYATLRTPWVSVFLWYPADWPEIVAVACGEGRYQPVEPPPPPAEPVTLEKIVTRGRASVEEYRELLKRGEI